ncbi:MAG: vWA domain-containing protein [Porticoccaceae bacterium]
MLTLAWPWMLVLLPLPLLYRWWRQPAADTTPALYAPVYAALANNADSGRRPGRPRHGLTLMLLSVVWIGALLAASCPMWIGDPVSLPASGRDLLLAVDISGSMEIEDMETPQGLVDRLSAVKAVVGQFVERRRGDRLGLVLFGSNAYLQTPLTFDRRTLNTLLQEARIGFAGKDTAIGDAIGLAVKRLQARPETSRVVILLTDGANTAGEIMPLQAAKLAAAHQVRIYTIGIGADEIYRRTLFGVQRINPSSDLDEAALTSIAQTTGGRYFRARNPQDLASIYGELDKLEPVAQAAATFRPSKALFHWPLAVALSASFALALWRSRGGDGG